MVVIVRDSWALLNDFKKLSTECRWTSNPSNPKFMQLFISVGDSCECEQDLALVMDK